MKKLKLARKFIESQGGFVTTRTHVQCIFCDQSVAISDMGSACPLCGHEYTIEDIQKAMRRPTQAAPDVATPRRRMVACPNCETMFGVELSQTAVQVKPAVGQTPYNLLGGLEKYVANICD